jgi:hypothetical protein
VLVLLPKLLDLSPKFVNGPFELAYASLGVGVRLLSLGEARQHWGNQNDHAEKYGSGESVRERGRGHRCYFVDGRFEFRPCSISRRAASLYAMLMLGLIT